MQLDFKTIKAYSLKSLREQKKAIDSDSATTGYEAFLFKESRTLRSLLVLESLIDQRVRCPLYAYFFQTAAAMERDTLEGSVVTIIHEACIIGQKLFEFSIPTVKHI